MKIFRWFIGLYLMFPVVPVLARFAGIISGIECLLMLLAWSAVMVVIAFYYVPRIDTSNAPFH